MATATKKAHSAKRVGNGARGTLDSSALEFLIGMDNGGDYHWELVNGSGESLVRSGVFASHDEAELGAIAVQEGAGSARFERRAAAKQQQPVGA